MVAVFFIAIGILVVLLISIIVRFRMYARKTEGRQNQSAAQITQLRQELANTKNELDKNKEQLADVRAGKEFAEVSRFVVSQMNEGIICVDSGRVVRLINPYAEQYVDFAVPGKVIGETVHVRVNGIADDMSLVNAAFAGATQTLPEATEIVCQRGAFPIRGSIVPLMTDNSVRMVALIFSDKSGEAERIKEEQAFFSAAAHELRTPLTVIRMTVALLAENLDTYGREKIMEHLRRTSETTEQLVKLVNDFLNVSRIDQGRLEIKTEPFDIVSLADEVIRDLTLLAKERKLFINHEPIESDFRMVNGDRARAKEVLTNLISNSIKYTVLGGVTVTHTLHNAVIETRIGDTGAGIPSDMQGLLFQRFQQIGGARALASTKSSGLGLYISKKFAQRMGGDVVLEHSVPGQGSTFLFTLPVH